MKRPLHTRAFALVWALAFVLGTAGEGFGLHPCPHHGTGPTGQGRHAAAAAHGTEAAHHGAAEVPSHGGEAHASGVDAGCGTARQATRAAQPSDPGEQHSGPCTCGALTCQAAAGAAAALPMDHPTAPEAEIVLRHTVRSATPEAAPPSRSPHFLPFAQAPPPRV